MVLLAAIAVGVVFTGALAKKAGEVLGVGDTAVTVWNIAKWPVLILLFSLVIALLYWAAPNVKRGFRWVSPGSILAVVIWIVASAASRCTWRTSPATTRHRAASRRSSTS
ncbi:uncharacterized BrkB/YihY/UPF0761 family membrane protein [Streptomyces sp. V1I1]|nr:uncharacterized BrkB/YihY/UPF0761 family membrane protein [Streptomyces sp. V1I1]